MRRAFHILAILLFALIVAWLYEVYYMRGGQLSRTNPAAQYIAEQWWWDSILWFEKSEEIINKPDTTITQKNTPEENNQKEKKQEEKKQEVIKEEKTSESLLAEYSTWSLNTINLKKLWISDSGDFSYTVLEYCSHSEDLCKDGHDSDIANEIVTLMWSDAEHMRKPFIWDLWSADALVRLGESCIATNNIDRYHDYIYKNWVPNSEQELQQIWEKLSIQWFGECVSWWSAEIYITQQMRLGNSLFGVTKIPSYVLIDNTNKNRALIPWLYPLKEMWEVLTKEFFE